MAAGSPFATLVSVLPTQEAPPALHVAVIDGAFHVSANEGFLKKRIDEAARFVPAEQLCLSPQCGFASSARSGLPMDLVERKLARIVEVADQVWG